jgi:hypothetical protein
VDRDVDNVRLGVGRHDKSIESVEVLQSIPKEIRVIRPTPRPMRLACPRFDLHQDIPLIALIGCHNITPDVTNVDPRLLYL